jgi:hypothetical protein
MSGGGGSFGRIGFHVGTEWQVYCYVYDDTTPIFDICAGSTSVAISVRDKTADKEAVEFARALLCGAQKFADEMQRMHAAHLDGDDSSTGKAAGSDAA